MDRLDAAAFELAGVEARQPFDRVFRPQLRAGQPHRQRQAAQPPDDFGLDVSLDLCQAPLRPLLQQADCLVGRHHGHRIDPRVQPLGQRGVAGGDQQPAGRPAHAERLQVHFAPGVVGDQQAGLVAQRLGQRIVELVEGRRGLAHDPAQRLDPLAQACGQVRGLAQGRPEDAVGERGLHLGVVAQRAGQHALADPAHAVQHVSLLHLDRGGAREATGADEEPLPHLGQQLRAENVVVGEGDVTVEVVTFAPAEPEEPGCLKGGLAADTGNQQLKGSFVVRIRPEVHPGATLQEGVDAFRVSAGQQDGDDALALLHCVLDGDAHPLVVPRPYALRPHEYGDRLARSERGLHGFLPRLAGDQMGGREPGAEAGLAEAARQICHGRLVGVVVGEEHIVACR